MFHIFSSDKDKFNFLRHFQKKQTQDIYKYFYNKEPNYFKAEFYSYHTLSPHDRVAAAMPEGHCGGFGTSSRMWCGTLKRLGTRRLRPDN